MEDKLDPKSEPDETSGDETEETPLVDDLSEDETPPPGEGGNPPAPPTGGNPE